MIKNLDIELLRTFIHVAKNRSFTETAKTLHKTQSAVSMQIKRLEESMGCKLFLRDKKSVELTADGCFFLSSANRVVNLNDKLLLDFEKSERSETIRIGFPDDYATLFLPEILSLYSGVFPETNLEVISDTSRSLIYELEKGNLDIVVSIDFNSGYGQVIRKEKLHWVASKDYVLTDDLSIPLALFPEDCIIRKAALERIQGSEVSWHLTFSGKNISTIHSLVLQGLAISVLGESMMPKGCKILDARQGFPSLPSLILSINKCDNPTPSVTQLYKYIREVISDKKIPHISRFE
ncbi:MAG: DNA-binding transcriptional LysR family regulator [Motiliproteus sp.]